MEQGEMGGAFGALHKDRKCHRTVLSKKLKKENNWEIWN
jgi:hypothetical protein